MDQARRRHVGRLRYAGRDGKFHDRLVDVPAGYGAQPRAWCCRALACGTCGAQGGETVLRGAAAPAFNAADVADLELEPLEREDPKLKFVQSCSMREQAWIGIF